MYVDQGRTAKEIAARISVTENTIGKWVDEGAWKAARDAYIVRPDMLVSSYEELLQALVDNRREMESDKETDPKDKVSLSDEISKVSKALEAARKDSRIPLSTYLKVMDSIFSSLQKKHPKIYLQLIDFQDEHINHIANQYE